MQLGNRDSSITSTLSTALALVNHPNRPCRSIFNIHNILQFPQTAAMVSCSVHARGSRDNCTQMLLQDTLDWGDCCQGRVKKLLIPRVQYCFSSCTFRFLCLFSIMTGWIRIVFVLFFWAHYICQYSRLRWRLDIFYSSAGFSLPKAASFTWVRWVPWGHSCPWGNQGIGFSCH